MEKAKLSFGPIWCDQMKVSEYISDQWWVDNIVQPFLFRNFAISAYSLVAIVRLNNCAYIDKYTTAFVLLSTLHILVTRIPVSQKNIHINICSILVQFCGRKFFSESTSHFFSEKTGTFQGKPNQEKSFFEKLIDDKLWFANALHCFEHFAPKHVLIIYNAKMHLQPYINMCHSCAIIYVLPFFTHSSSIHNEWWISVSKGFFSYSTSENSNFKPSSSFLLLRMEFSSFWKIGVSILVDS